VRATAAQILRSTLPLKPFGRRATAPQLRRLLLTIAALGVSLSGAVKRFRFPFSHETARQALRQQLPDADSLQDQLGRALGMLLPRRTLRRRTWLVAIDRHDTPFYGDRTTPGRLGGPRKRGTHYFYSYATVTLVSHGQRWCLGVIRLGHARMEEAVADLLDRLGRQGIRLRTLLLDAGFFSGRVVKVLQDRRLPFVLAVGRKGSGRDNRLGRLFALPAGTVTLHRWQVAGRRGEPGFEVAVKLVTVRRQLRGRRWRKQVYAFGRIRGSGVPGRLAWNRQVCQLYRQRFGIETSYRQMNEGLGRTTAKDTVWRLLLVGLALLLRNVWVWLGQQNAGWTLAEMLDYLGDALVRHRPDRRVVPLKKPLDLDQLALPTAGP
jgi:hypothetical protein